MRTHPTSQELRNSPGLAWMRRWSRHAWLLHGWLMASLVLMPIGRLDAGYRMSREWDASLNEGNGDWIYRTFDDQNENGTLDEGESATEVLASADPDADGLTNDEEYAYGTSPYNPDSDYDGVTDGDEVHLLGGGAAGYSPTNWDTNGDGYSDHDEFYNCHTVNYITAGAGYSYYDWDGDGIKNHEDQLPFDPTNYVPPTDTDGDGVYDSQDSDPSNDTLWSDWNHNGVNDTQDSDGDGTPDDNDSHPFDNSLSSDWNNNGYNDGSEPPLDSDNDGVLDGSDSHPHNPALWSDWNHNGINDDLDSDGDGVMDENDSNPGNSSLWCDWNHSGVNDDQDTDHDGRTDDLDSHPTDVNLWCDWNHTGINDDQDTDNDGHPDDVDSNPDNYLLWSDWDHSGINDDQDSDADGHTDDLDSDPQSSALWNDWNHNGINDTQDTDGDGHYDEVDSHPTNASLWADWNNAGFNDGDGDGHADTLDSHPLNSSLWSDWDNSGINDDQDSDADGHPDDLDSDPQNINLWNDWNHNGTSDTLDTDNDGHPDEQDTDPTDPLLWNDYNHNGVSDTLDTDHDGVADDFDSDPQSAGLWDDWNRNGVNDHSEPPDYDHDGYPDDVDSDPYTNSLWSDWNHNGTNYADSDGDGVPDDDDSHPGLGWLWSDWDGDGYNETSNDIDGDGVLNGLDSHPTNIYLWDDWDRDGYNGSNDSNPTQGNLWSDWDNDGFNENDDSDPGNSSLWSDWDHDGYNEGQSPPPHTDTDGDGIWDTDDSDPNNPNLWNDFNHNGINESEEGGGDSGSDSDGVPDVADSDPNNGLLWCDWNRNGINDTAEHAMDRDDDADGVANGIDSDVSNPAFWSDWDHDGLNEETELQIGTDPRREDTDGDGLLDGEEQTEFHTDPRVRDTDGDGLTDFEEVRIAPLSNPLNKWSRSELAGTEHTHTDGQLADLTDSDDDGIPNRIEVTYGLNPLDPADSMGDMDGDEISNLDEYLAGTSLWGDSSARDTDRDGITDLLEDAWNQRYPGLFSKISPVDATQDADHDGVLNFEELDLGLNPKDFNTLTEVQDTIYASTLPSPDLVLARTMGHPTWQMPVAEGDTDGDGMPDAWEYKYRARGGLTGLNLRSAGDASQDTDGDGLTNLQEFQAGRDPLVDESKAAGGSPDGDSHTGAGTGPYEPEVATHLGSGSSHNFGFIEGSGNAPGGDAPDDGNETVEVASFTFANGSGYAASDAIEDDWHVGNTITQTSAPVVQHVTSPCQPSVGNPSHVNDTCSCMTHGKAERFCATGDGSEGSSGGYWEDPEHTPEDSSDDIWVPTGGAVSGSLVWTENPFVHCDTAADNYTDPGWAGRAAIRARMAGISGNVHSYKFEKRMRDPNGQVNTVDYEMFIPIGSLEARIDDFVENGQSVTLTFKPDGSEVRPGSPPSPVNASDGTGPRYRKVGLNGVPMPDAKPQVQNENGENEEETYIDAFTAQLRHSVSDVYVTDAATLEPLAVRRDLTSESWDLNGGLRPHERPTQPFGICWSSNICSYVRFDDGIIANVVDEMGSQQRYYYIRHEWFHDRQEDRDVKTRQNVFAATHTAGSEAGSYQNITLTKKFGTKCTYEMISRDVLMQAYPGGRLEGGDPSKIHLYARLTHVEDRWGNVLVYEYPDAGSLIPCVIKDPNRPGHEISIHQEDGRVTHIRGPGGDTIDYGYTQLDLNLSIPTVGDIPDPYVLTSVTRGGHTVHYQYTSYEEAHTLVPEIGLMNHHHTELTRITDERDNHYDFAYRYNTSLIIQKGNMTTHQSGLPMVLTSVTTPITGTVTIDNHREVDPRLAAASLPQSARYLDAAQPAWTSFTWGTGEDARTYTYRFTEPVVMKPTGYFQATEDAGLSLTYAFQKMEIEAPDGGKEYYRFNKDANLALAETTDRNNYKTTFVYGDVMPNRKTLAGGLLHEDATQLFDDPTKEIHVVNGVTQTKTFVYDAATRILKSVTDSRGVKTDYTIDALGRRRQEKIAGPASMAGGRVETYDFPTTGFKGFMTSKSLAVNPDDPNKAPLGHFPVMTTSYSLDADHDKVGWWRMVTETRTIQNQESSTLTVSDFNGNKRSVTDARNNTTSFDYDGGNRLRKVTYPDGTFKEMEYDAHGNLTKEVDETGKTTFHQYDALNRRVTTTIDLNDNGEADIRGAGDLVQETTFNDLNLPLRQTDARGVVTEHEYDKLGRLLKTTVNANAATEAEKQVTQLIYKAPGINGGKEAGSSIFDISGFKPVKSIDPEGHVTTCVYDELGRVKEKTSTDAGTVYTTYASNDSSANALTVSRPEDAQMIAKPGYARRKTTFAYDALGQVKRTQYADGNATQVFYTPHGKPWKSIDEMGNVSLMYYDGSGLPVKTKAPPVNGVSAVTQTGYDAVGNVVSVTDALGRVTYTEYDSRNRPVKVTLPEVVDAADAAQAMKHPVTLTEYDEGGRVIKTTDPIGHETRTFYDEAGRVLRTVDALNHETSMTYDENGNVLTTTNAMNQTVSNGYDAFNRLTESTDAEGIVNRFGYDKVGNRIRVEDGMGHVSTFAYDGQKRLVQQVYEGSLTAPGVTAAHDTWAFTYDAAVKLSQMDPAGHVVSFTYDSRDRVKTLKTLATAAVPANTRTNTYDKGGRLLSVTESSNVAAAEVIYTYDEIGRVKTEKSSGVTHTYGYDILGNRTSAVYGDGRKVVTAYDELNRPLTIMEGPAATFEADKQTTIYGYDLAGRALRLRSGNGQVTQNTYDAVGRLTYRALHQAAPASGGNKQAEFSWGHNAVYNVTQQTEVWYGANARTRVTAMTYDDANRLATEEIAETAAQTITTAYGYDDGNNRTSKVVTATGSGVLNVELGYWSYTFNAANQQVRTDKRETAEGTVVAGANYLYDANGNRASRVTDEDSSGSSSVESRTTKYLWDVENFLVGVKQLDESSSYTYAYDYRTRRISTHKAAVGEQPAQNTAIVFSGGLSVAEYENGNTTPNVHYVRGPDMGGGVGGMLYSIRDGSTVKYILSNGRGDIVAQSDSTAALTWTASYEAFGKRTKETGTNLDKQRANSKDEDPTGLLNEGHRYRDLESGAFISRDPAGFVDGPNVYAYVKQNPWTGFDPEGLEDWGINWNDKFYGFRRTPDEPDWRWETGGSRANEPLLSSWVGGFDYAKDSVQAIADNPKSYFNGLIDGESDGTVAGDRGAVGRQRLDTGLEVGGACSRGGSFRMPKSPGPSLAPAGGGAIALPGVQSVTLPMPVLFNNGQSPESSQKPAQEEKAKETGSYTNTHESGKTYDGKGDKARSQTSGKRVEKETGDKHVATDWTPASSTREAFKQESQRLDSNGGAKSDSNHNKIESPGKKMRVEDGEAGDP